MDTSQIKRFAVEARNILKQGVINRITALGFDEKGEVAERNKPQHLQGKTLFMGQLYDENFYGKWMALYNRVRTKGVKEVYEEAAYTWFNRMMAIRIMEKNGFTDPVLSFDDDRLRIPRIVSNARAGQVYISDESDREKLSELLMDDTKTTEQFTLLITAFCHSNPVINNCFGGVSDYTEILLPTNILSEGGFVDLLNHTAFITDDDYRQSELIGWLYQFYISEKKDEVFASFKGGKKAEAEDIPAATQIFTPNWIVKYMVQNTVGRIFLDNNPSSDLKDKWKYLVEPSTPTPDDCIFKYDDPKELTMADLGCGSGHILNEGFDILYDIYIEEGYSRKQAIENIFKYNLTGVDIDTRAKQLATFALMMKACQKDDSFLDCHVMPNVLDMPEPIEALNKFFGCFMHDMVHSNTMVNAVKLCQQANNLGSIMKFDITEKDRKDLYFCINRWYEEHEIHEFNNNPNDVKTAKLLLALTNKYASVVMNPPYMERGNMNPTLSEYVQDYYSIGRNDLFSVFMMLALERLNGYGKYGMINMDTWIYKSSFLQFRESFLDNSSIDSLILLGARTFEELSGEVVQNVAFIVTNKNVETSSGLYCNLSMFTTCDNKRIGFENSILRMSCIKQSAFHSTPGKAICIIPNSMFNILSSSRQLKSDGDSKQGLATGNNDLFLREWWEISKIKLGTSLESTNESVLSGKKWFPYNKGGNRRKWYGNQEFVVNWENDGYEIKHFMDDKGKLRSRPQNTQCYFQPSISWGLISGPFFRCYPKGFIYDIQGMSFFPNENLYGMISWMNSKVFRILGKSVNPREQYQAGDLLKLPTSETLFPAIAEKSITISKSDWDAHETSWDFASNELLSINESNFLDIIADYADYEGCCIDPAPAKLNSLEWHLNMYHKKWETKFHRLQQNEEELNRHFIEIYGLQDELTPDVPMEEITILQQGEISIEDNHIVWHDDVVIKQLISYAIGCMMGRYRLDREGLWIAHPNPTSDEICTYHYNENDYTIDDDGIMPVMSRDCGFDDNGVLRFTEFLRVAFGEEKLTENLNFVERCLGKTIEDYLKKDFWKDHKKMYQNRPIYWLFSSKKGAFQVLAYMHRMNPYTVEQIRNKYLLPHIDYLTKKIDEMEMKEATLSTSERRTLQKLKTDLAECQEYHERLHLVADQQIGFDLDDGVVVNYAKFGDVVAKIK